MSRLIVQPCPSGYCTLIQQVCHSWGGRGDNRQERRQTTLSTDKDISRVKVVFLFESFREHSTVFILTICHRIFFCGFPFFLLWSAGLELSKNFTHLKLSALTHTLIFCSTICIGCHAKIITFFPASLASPSRH